MREFLNDSFHMLQGVGYKCATIFSLSQLQEKYEVILTKLVVPERMLSVIVSFYQRIMTPVGSSEEL